MTDGNENYPTTIQETPLVVENNNENEDDQDGRMDDEDAGDNKFFRDGFAMIEETEPNDDDSNKSDDDEHDIHCENDDDQQQQQQQPYNRRKPRWWRQLSGKATKAQRASIQAMKEAGYVLERPARYGDRLDWKSIFHNNNNTINNNQDIWLEVGFGSGDNLVCLAYDNPHICFVGAEVHANGVAKVCQTIQKSLQQQQQQQQLTSSLENLAPTIQRYTVQRDPFYAASTSSSDAASSSLAGSSSSSSPLQQSDQTVFSNLRVFAGDGMGLLQQCVSDHSLSCLLITFPDPFCKSNEQEWRIVQPSTLQLMRQKLKPKGGRLYLATDHPGVMENAQDCIAEINQTNQPIWHRVDPCPPRREWLPVISAYEAKGWEAGRHTLMSCWQLIEAEQL